MNNESARPKVGYVLKCFPRLSETFILNEILELERQGVEVEIFSLNPPGDPRFHGDLARLKAEIQYLPRADSSRMWSELQVLASGAGWDPSRLGDVFSKAVEAGVADGYRPFMQALWIAAQARRRRIDHLHAHFATLATRVAMNAHKLSGVPFSFTAHAKDIHQSSTNRDLIVGALRHCRFAVTVTDFNVGVLSRLCTSQSSKVRRIYNGPSPHIHRAPADERSRSDIVGVGRLVEKKGFRYLVEACRRLKTRGIRFRCRIIGRGPLESQLLQQIRRCNLSDSVLLTGAASHRTVLEAMRTATLVTLPCVVADDGDRDALPTVLLEAMALGRPVVSTQMEGVDEMVVPERTGLLVPQRDPAALAGALTRLLSDPGLRSRFGDAGRERVERIFDIRENVARLAHLFGESQTRPRVVPFQAPSEVRL